MSFATIDAWERPGNPVHGTTYVRARLGSRHLEHGFGGRNLKQPGSHTGSTACFWNTTDDVMPYRYAHTRFFLRLVYVTITSNNTCITLRSGQRTFEMRVANKDMGVSNLSLCTASADPKRHSTHTRSAQLAGSAFSRGS